MTNEVVKGVKIATAECGIKYKNRDDLLLVAFEDQASVVGVFTSSSMRAAPILWCEENIKNGKAKALIVNSGNANAFTGEDGKKTVLKTVEAVAENLKCDKTEVFVSSTGVIGEPLNADLITAQIPNMVKNFGSDESFWHKASKAIMTTDTKPKIIFKSCYIGDKKVSIAGFAKGSGMIAPNMATMLAYVFTDADISEDVLYFLTSGALNKSFNSITVDSDQSTNDTLLVFATKKAGNEPVIKMDRELLNDFKNCLEEICVDLAKMIVIDGEGAKKLIEIEVAGAAFGSEAKAIAMAIANSPLVKTAIAGCDPNWGRIVMAVGKSCRKAIPRDLVIKIGDYQLTKDGGRNPDYVEELVHEYLKGSFVKIFVSLGITPIERGIRSVVWTCDLNEEYIKINKDYRS